MRRSILIALIICFLAVQVTAASSSSLKASKKKNDSLPSKSVSKRVNEAIVDEIADKHTESAASDEDKSTSGRSLVLPPNAPYQSKVDQGGAKVLMEVANKAEIKAQAKSKSKESEDDEDQSVSNNDTVVSDEDSFTITDLMTWGAAAKDDDLYLQEDDEIADIRAQDEDSLLEIDEASKKVQDLKQRVKKDKHLSKAARKVQKRLAKKSL